MRAWPFVPCIAGVLLAHGPASAACRVENVTPIAFGGYTSGSALPLDSVGELDVSCAGTTQVRILLGHGTGGRLGAREMRGASGSLAYGLFLDAARTSAWGDGSEGTSPLLAFLPAGQITRIPIFGRIFGRQGVPAGRYVDQITVTVVF